MTILTKEQNASWDEKGYFIIEKYATQETCQAMLDFAVRLSREADEAQTTKKSQAFSIGKSLVVLEKKVNPDGAQAEDYVSKIFSIHRESPFKEFCEDDRLLDLVEGLLGPELDCFLSQFIFKNPKAMGQPWHQDSHYFKFDRTPQVGVWLAVTEATLDNGCLHVLPGSHKEPVHAHVPDKRPEANYAYVEIVDHDMSLSIPVLLQAGDLLIFHSHLMHKSKDNVSKGIRAAMVCHYAQAGTKDQSSSPVNDWMPVRRQTK